MKLYLISITTLILFPVFCFSNTIHVPADQATIQEGIDAAMSGDTVLVAPGTYFERIDFKGKDIIVASESGPAATVIDGEHLGSVVTFQAGETALAELKGFTVTSGEALNGGGIYCSESHPTITGNIIEANHGDNEGGGIYCSKCSPTITDNIIRANTGTGGVKFWLCYYDPPLLADNVIEDNYSEKSGAGVSCTSCSPEISGNIITHNTTEIGGGGISCYNGEPVVTGNTITYNAAMGIYGRAGGIDIYSSTRAHVSHNVISHNSAAIGGGLTCNPVGSSQPEIVGNEISYNTATLSGGGMGCYSGVYYVIGNRIEYNTAPSGGGIIFFQSSKAVVKENTITNNSADNGGGINFAPLSYPAGIQPSLISNLVVSNVATANGGGVYCDEAFPRIINCTIAVNAAAMGGGIYVTGGAAPQYTNGILWNNEAPIGAQIDLDGATIQVDYSDVQGGWTGTGNIDSDPLFIDEMNDDFHLTYLSACRNVGDNSSITQGLDFEGDKRIAFGTVDMGADEFYNHMYCTGDFTPNGLIEGRFIGAAGTTPVGLFIGSGVLDPPIQHNWGKFYLESPWLLFPLVPIPSDGVLRISAHLPSTVAPYDIPMQALIGWELSNLFVLEVR